MGTEVSFSSFGRKTQGKTLKIMNEYEILNSEYMNHSSIHVNSSSYTPPNTVIIRESRHGLPKKATDGSVGYDIKAEILNSITINPGESYTICTGTSVQLPPGWCIWVTPRSGLAKNKSITIPNSPGLIDSDYRGTIKVILRNEGTDPYIVEDGDRIAQLTFMQIPQVTLVTSGVINDTARGTRGFGSTGT
jgi:dUTP pyrophosphatase